MLHVKKGKDDKSMKGKNMKRFLSFVLSAVMVLTAINLPAKAEGTENETGEVLYYEDFSDFDITSITPYGYSYQQGAVAKLAVEDGKLVVNTRQQDITTEGYKTKSLYGSHGTRIKLYEIPEDITSFSVSVDVKLNQFEGVWDGTKYESVGGSTGPGLLIADNGVSGTSAGTAADQALFSMIWMRKYNIGTSGAYTYGVTNKNAVASNKPGICDEGDNYTVKVKVDGTNGTFKIINTTDNTVYESAFIYNPGNTNRMVGFYASICNVEFDNLCVCSGDLAYGDAKQVTANVQTLQKDGSEQTVVVGGSVSGTGKYNIGAKATLTATPIAGYSFVKWVDVNGNDVATTVSCEVPVTGDASYTAVFQEGASYVDGQLIYDMSVADPVDAQAYGYAYNKGYYRANSFGYDQGTDTYLMNTIRPKSDAIGGRYASRVKLFDIPDGVTSFSAKVDVILSAWGSTDGVTVNNADGWGNAVGMIISDNMTSDTATTGTGSSLSKFDMVWIRPNFATSGARLGYGSNKGQQEFGSNTKGLGDPGRYTISVYVNGSSAVYEILNRDTLQSFRKTFTYSPASGMNESIGLYSNGAYVSYSGLEVYYGDGVGLSGKGASAASGDMLQGHVLYDMNKDYDTANAPVPYGYGYTLGSCKDYGLQEDGTYRLNTIKTEAEGGRYGTRVSLYDVPEGVTKFSVEVDLTIHEHMDENSGVALVFADNKATDAKNGSSSAFSMIWLRYQRICAYRYGGGAYHDSAWDNKGIIIPGNYNLKLYVDTNGTCEYKVTNKDTNKTYSSEFTYNSPETQGVAAAMRIGFFSNGATVSFRDLKVYNGDGVGLVSETPSGAYEEGQKLYDMADKGVSILSEAQGAGAEATVSDIKNGSIQITATSANIGGRNGNRYNMFNVPADADRFSAEVDVQIHKFNDNTNGSAAGLIIADDGASSDVRDTGLNYSMIWLRRSTVQSASSGAYTYSDYKPSSVDKQYNTIKDICSAGDIYTIKVCIDGLEGKYQIYNKTTGTYYMDTFTYNPLGLERKIGFYVNSCDVTFSNLKVYYGDQVFNEGNYVLGQVLYSQDFSSSDVKYTARVASEVKNVQAPTVNVENEALRVVSGLSEDKKNPGTVGTRIELFDLPRDVEEFSAEIDIKVNEYITGGEGAGSVGLALSSSDSAGSYSHFTMIWLRQKGAGTAGAYNYIYYKGTNLKSKFMNDASFDSVVNMDSDEHPVVAGEPHEYTVKVHVKNNRGTVEIINNTTGQSWKNAKGSEFYYNPMGTDRTIGIYANAVDVSVDNLKVYYGDAVFTNDIADSRKAFEVSVWDETEEAYITKVYTDSLGEPYVKNLVSQVGVKAPTGKVLVTMQKDYALTSAEDLADLTVAGREVILDLNGYTLTQNAKNAIFTSNAGTLTLKNGTLKLAQGSLVDTDGALNVNVVNCDIDLTDVVKKITLFDGNKATVTGSVIYADTYKNISIGNVIFKGADTKLSDLEAGGLIPTEIFKDEKGNKVSFVKADYSSTATEATLKNFDDITFAVWSWDKTNNQSSILNMYEAGVEAVTGKKQVTAPVQSAYTFVGWYEPVKDGDTVTGYGAELSKDVQLSSHKDMEAVAVYEAQTQNVKLTVDAGVAYTIRDAKGNVLTGTNNVYTLPIGSKVTLETTADNFLNWQNANSKIVSTSKKFVLTVGVNTDLVLVTSNSAEAGVFVKWLSVYNQVLQAEYVTAENAENVTYPIAPTAAEGKFTGWSITSTELSSKITDIVNNGAELVLDIEALYEEHTAKYTVTVIANGKTSDAVEDIVEGTSVKVTAPIVSGKVFSHWSDAATDGKVLSTKETYLVLVNSDMTLYAIYSDAETEKTPIINMTNVYYVDEADDVHKIAFEATRSIPDGYKVLETGILYAVVEPTSVDAFVMDGTNVYKFVAKSTAKDGVFTLYVNVTGHEDATVWARGYVVVQDAAGLITTLYDEEISSKSYYGLRTYRVLMTSDMHYTTTTADSKVAPYGLTHAERMELWVEAIKKEHATQPLDLIIVNGDLSYDYWAIRDNNASKAASTWTEDGGDTKTVVETYISELEKIAPVIVLPGNHDRYDDATWRTLTGNSRQCSYVVGNNLFIMPFTYADSEKDNTNSATNGTYTQVDMNFVNGEIAKYPNHNIYIVSHEIDMSQESDDFKNLLKQDNVKGLFAGHTHMADTVDLSTTYSINKTLARTGHFSFSDDITATPWGFRDLVIAGEDIVSSYISAESDLTVINADTNEDETIHVDRTLKNKVEY